MLGSQILHFKVARTHACTGHCPLGQHEHSLVLACMQACVLYSQTLTSLQALTYSQEGGVAKAAAYINGPHVAVQHPNLH